MRETTFRLSPGGIPAVLYGEPSDRVWLYLHGKCGCKEEGAAFAEIACPAHWQVLAVDLPKHGARRGSAQAFAPWDAVPELRALLDYARQRYRRVALRATSLGAWFSLLAFGGQVLDRALFVSPVLDMERLIRDMMGWAGVDEKHLRAEGELVTHFGETLSWRYLQYVRAHPVTDWITPTAILYGAKDHLNARETVDAFVRAWGAGLTVLEDGEHYLHTPGQRAALSAWERGHI